jgi:hypothetical protein
MQLWQAEGDFCHYWLRGICYSNHTIPLLKHILHFPAVAEVQLEDIWRSALSDWIIRNLWCMRDSLLQWTP